MITFNTKFDSAEALKTFVSENKINTQANVLVQVFTGICDLTFIETLVDTLKELVPHIKIIGTTTDGEIIDDKVLKKETVLSFTLFEDTKVVTYFQEHIDDSYLMAKKLISNFGIEARAKVAITFTDGLHTNGEAYLNAFYEFDNKLVVSGGLAGDNAEFKQSVIFTEDRVLNKGCVVALLYNNNLIVHTKANFGWENIGKTLTITKAQDNIVYEIDDCKAVDIYAKYLGDDIADELPKTGIEFPLIIKRDGFNIARAVVGKNSDGSLVFAGNLHIGDSVSFGYGNIEAIVHNGNKPYTDLVKTPVESIFIYSCMARKALMGESISLELKALNSITSLSGFFTYGEFYSNKETLKNELLNQTMTILSLSENTTIKHTSKEFTTFQDRRGTNKTLKALSHLIAQTTGELEEINNSLECKVQEELKKSHQKDQQMMQQSRLAQMGEMLSMIAHQWRQPLAAIASSSTALQLKAELGKTDKEMIIKKSKQISKYAQHLSATIDDFRDFFKPNKEKRETSLCEVVKSVLSIVQVPIQNKNITIIKELNCKSKFQSYPNELRQVLLNLMKNAEDILLEKEIEDPWIKIITRIENNKYFLEVSDNGGGIKEENLDKIFDPYFSTKLQKDGTGLGLYMSKTIIEEHCGGKLNVCNSAEGALFTIELEG